MRETGIVRKTDNLGRVVLPSELRRYMDFEKGDSVSITIQNKYIVLKKFKQSCAICNGNDNVIEFKGKGICQKCLNKIRS